MSKLLCNVLKISGGGKCPRPWLRAWVACIFNKFCLQIITRCLFRTWFLSKASLRIRFSRIHAQRVAEVLKKFSTIEHSLIVSQREQYVLAFDVHTNCIAFIYFIQKQAMELQNILSCRCSEHLSMHFVWHALFTIAAMNV